jgi:hypothetical protein
VTVRQIIQEIEALPSEQREEVLTLLVQKGAHRDSAAPAVQYADHDKAMQIADRIFTERAELFKKLAA